MKSAGCNGASGCNVGDGNVGAGSASGGTLITDPYLMTGGSGLSVETTGVNYVTLGTLKFMVAAGTTAGKADITINPVGVGSTVIDDNNAAAIPASGVTLNGSFVQVGPGPNLQFTSITPTPIGSGSSFDLKFTVSNVGATASDPDSVHISITGATLPTTGADAWTGDVALSSAALAVGGSENFEVTPVALTGSTASLTFSFDTVGHAKSATYSPVNNTQETNVNATMNGYLVITPTATIWIPGPGRHRPDAGRLQRQPERLPDRRLQRLLRSQPVQTPAAPRPAT